MHSIAVKLDMMQTLGLAADVLFASHGIRRRVGVRDLVGAFFIDFTNALIITIFISIVG